MHLQLGMGLIISEEYMLPCLSKQVLGFECPGCGLQRSVHLLFQGEFLTAFKMYPAIYTLILLFCFLLVNNFFNIKYANQIIIALSGSSVLLILGNYILKLTH
ncbi:MAG: DUF2752 domain-containing protein [Bacteroidota bacterium]